MFGQRALMRATTAMLIVAGFASEASANERHFTYTYESGVLPAGGRELEVWTTWRGGRRRFYSAFDHRFEYEVGLTSRLQTAFYFNVGSVTSDAGFGDRSTSFQGHGVSSEWKYKLLDSVADPVGLALYGELGMASDALNVEAKIIIDKRMGNFLLAGNLVFEPEWKFVKRTKKEIELEANVAAAYFPLPNVSVGLEMSNRSELEGPQMNMEWSSLHAGPVIAYAHEEWWVSMSFLRQLPAPANDNAGSAYVIRAGELYNARLLFSFHL